MSGSPRGSPRAFESTVPDSIVRAVHSKETGFGISQDALDEIILEKDVNVLARYGGVKGVLKKLRSDPEHGLSSDVAPHHRNMFGSSRLPSKPCRAWPYHMLDALNDVVLVALVIASIVLWAFGVAYSQSSQDVLQGVGIMMAVLVVAGTTSVQSFNQEREMSALGDIKNDRLISVLRDGKEQGISANDLVVGDILVLRPGEIILGDGVFLSGHGLRCDESAATGESFLVSKGSDNLFFIGGSKVMHGWGHMLVLSVGLNSTYGKIREVMDDMEPPPSALQDKLELLATRIGYFGLTMGVAVFLVLTISFLVLKYPLYTGAFRAILNFFILGITLIVVAVPEGLPLALTLTQLTTLRQMSKHRVTVKELLTCEQLGGVTAITTDKTGSVTSGRMVVARGWFFGNLYDSVPDLAKVAGPARRDLLARACALNSDASISYTGEAMKVFRTSKPGGLTATGGPRALAETEAATIAAMGMCDCAGSTTEVALLHMLRMDLDLDYSAVRKGAGPFVHREPFVPSKGRSLTVYAPASPGASTAPLKTLSDMGTQGLAPPVLPGSGKFTVYAMGTPESVLASCAMFMTGEGALIPLEARRRESLASVTELLAGRGLRPLAIAYKTLDPSAAPHGSEAGGERGSRAWSEAVGAVEGGLTLLAVVGIRDPPRPGVAEAVAQCAQGGIKVRLVSGEHMLCARAVAEETGILRDGVALDGAAWRGLSPDERSAVLPRLEVLARATPADKLMLVEALKELGEVVMSTGDATEDAGVLAAASIGVAIGSGAVEVAKEAARVVAADGDFRGLVMSIVWGRAILENIRKFLCFQLTINGVACVLTLVSAVLHMGSDTPFPLQSIQLLWINLIMDSFGALMLATEAPDAELMYLRPMDKAVPLVSPNIVKQVLWQGLTQLAILLFLSLSTQGASVFFLGPEQLGGSQHYTCVFNTFVFFQLANYFNARRIHDQQNLLHGLSANWFGVALLLAIAVGQVLFVEVGGGFFQTFPLGILQLVIGAAFGLISLGMGALSRACPPYDASFAAAGRGSKSSAKVAPDGLEGGMGATRASTAGGATARTPYKPWMSLGGASTSASTGGPGATGRSSMRGGGASGSGGGGGGESTERMRLTGGGGSASASASARLHSDAGGVDDEEEGGSEAAGSHTTRSQASARGKLGAKVSPFTAGNSRR